MRKTMIMLYSRIINLLTVSLSWFRESRPLHILHSVTLSPELCCNALVQEIGMLSKSISGTAQVSSLAEQRDMHSVTKRLMSKLESMEGKIDDRLTMFFQELSELKTAMVVVQALNSSAQVSIRQQVSQLQLMSFINNLTLNLILDPTKSPHVSLPIDKR